MRISTIWKEDFEQNRKMLENFKEDLNSSFRNMTLEVSIPVHKVIKYEEEINKFNTECYKIKNKKFNKNDKTSILKRTLKTNYEKLMNELIKVRNLKQKLKNFKFKIRQKLMMICIVILLYLLYQ